MKYNADTQTTSVLDTAEISSLIILKYSNGENINYATSFNADTSVITLNTLQLLIESASIELSYGGGFQIDLLIVFHLVLRSILLMILVRLVLIVIALAQVTNT